MSRQKIRDAVEVVEAKGGQGRAMLADALFERIEVLGLREATVYLSAHPPWAAGGVAG